MVYFSNNISLLNPTDNWINEHKIILNLRGAAGDFYILLLILPYPRVKQIKKLVKLEMEYWNNDQNHVLFPIAIVMVTDEQTNCPNYWTFSFRAKYELHDRANDEQELS